MNAVIKEIIDTLHGFEARIMNTAHDQSILAETYGWNYIPLSAIDCANMIKNIYTKLILLEISEIDKNLAEELKEIPQRINLFANKTLPQLFNHSSHQAAPNFFSLIQWINLTIDPLFSWQTLNDNKALPNQLGKKLRSIQAELNEIVPQKEELEAQIKLIKNATDAAETLPTDLENLKDARQKTNKILSDSSELYGKIDSYFKTIEATVSKIQLKKEETDKLVAQCEEAYKITTTKGLAGAFDVRAKNLSNSMWIWVFGLLLALLFGVFIGSHRFEVLNDAMKSEKEVRYIWVQIFLSVVSLGAPIWFAWIATKQISQRFKLAEDYAFKASVAKAYEGYRREAANIDEELEIRLFSSALTRLEEAPLRLMESEHHGSPWHEFISSPQFKKAIETIPDLKDQLVAKINSSISKDKDPVD